MTASIITGAAEWKATRNADGHRTYTVSHKVRTTDINDGPAVVMAATGLPAIGSTWSYGNDSDSWAFCTPEMEVVPLGKKDQKGYYWRVTQQFTTIPMTRCNTDSIDDPLDEPDRISGSFVKFTREAQTDKDGNPILTSSKEQVRGSAVERDFNNPTVSIEMNLSSLPLSTFSQMVDTVNDATLWGLGARKIKLSNVKWSRKLYGTCSYYYVVGYEFDIDYAGFDREILDVGTRTLVSGGTDTNPLHYTPYRDPRTQDTGSIILDGSGEAWDGTGTPGTITAEFYDESDFLLLGVPSSLT